MSHSIFKINFDTQKHTVLYECISNIKDAELLAQLAMVNKSVDDLIFISAGWNRGIENNPEEYEKALELAEKYKCERSK